MNRQEWWALLRSTLRFSFEERPLVGGLLIGTMSSLLLIKLLGGTFLGCG